MQKVITVLVSDISGEDAAETVPFGLDGTQYEVDLTEVEAKALREALEPYVTNARRTGGRRKRRNT